MIENKEFTATNDGPSKDENVWLSVAITIFLATIIISALAALWVFTESGPVEVTIFGDQTRDLTSLTMQQRAQAFTPFGLVLAGTVSFLTVVWRGLVATKQYEEQRRQNNLKDEELLTELLADGAALLTKKPQSADAIVGIASLEAVVISKSERLRMPAMRVLSKFIADSFEAKEYDHWRTAIEAFNHGAMLGLRVEVQYNFETEDEAFQWPIINGIQHVAYNGGTMREEQYSSRNHRTSRSFVGVRMQDCRISKSFDGFSCVFEQCSFERLYLPRVTGNEFFACDFSGTEIAPEVMEDADAVAKLSASGGQFIKGKPPICRVFDNWSTIFKEVSIDLRKKKR